MSDPNLNNLLEPHAGGAGVAGAEGYAGPTARAGDAPTGGAAPAPPAPAAAGAPLEAEGMRPPLRARRGRGRPPMQTAYSKTYARVKAARQLARAKASGG